MMVAYQVTSKLSGLACHVTTLKLLSSTMADTRFARLKSDPRFRRPRKKEAKVVIDDRFKTVFSTDKAAQKAGISNDSSS